MRVLEAHDLKSKVEAHDLHASSEQARAKVLEAQVCVLGTNVFFVHSV